MSPAPSKYSMYRIYIFFINGGLSIKRKEVKKELKKVRDE